MRKFSLLITILALGLAVFALAGCGSDDDDEAWVTRSPSS